jgi:hypothetical protein
MVRKRARHVCAHSQLTGLPGSCSNLTLYRNGKDLDQPTYLASDKLIPLNADSHGLCEHQTSARQATSDDSPSDTCQPQQPLIRRPLQQPLPPVDRSHLPFTPQRHAPLDKLDDGIRRIGLFPSTQRGSGRVRVERGQGG